MCYSAIWHWGSFVCWTNVSPEWQNSRFVSDTWKLSLPGWSVWWRKEMEEKMSHFSKFWILERRILEGKDIGGILCFIQLGAGCLGDDECFYICSEGFHYLAMASGHNLRILTSPFGIQKGDFSPETWKDFKLSSAKLQPTNLVDLELPWLAFNLLLLKLFASTPSACA